MTRNPSVFSIHQYRLKPGVDDEDFVSAIREAEERGCFEIPGLKKYRFGRGIRGTRKGDFAAHWLWENLDIWEEVWGPIDDPVDKPEYPDPWLVWEDEILHPLLREKPDKISYTAYKEIET